MGLHVARQLLDATILRVTGLTTTGANVFRNRPDGRSLTASEIPALLVYLGGEDVDPATVDNTLMYRTQRIRIGLRVKSTEGSDNTLTDMRMEVETALQPRLLVGLALKPVQLSYTGMADPEFEGDSEQPVASAEMEFTAQLYTQTPDVLL